MDGGGDPSVHLLYYFQNSNLRGANWYMNELYFHVSAERGKLTPRRGLLWAEQRTSSLGSDLSGVLGSAPMSVGDAGAATGCFDSGVRPRSE